MPTAQESADRLYRALRERVPVPPLSEVDPELDVDKAYEISQALLARRIADGERVLGKKIGLTSLAVQANLGIDSPDFGFLTDAMSYPNGSEVPISTSLIAPRAEGELAFVLRRDLQGPGIEESDVIDATEGVQACFEIVDSRIRNWEITLCDTVADNASCGFYVLGGDLTDPKRLDLVTCGMVVEKNGEVASTGAGAACLGSPALAVAWLANALAKYEISLEAGETILSGSFVPLIPVEAGDEMRVRTSGAGEASVRFV